MPLIPTRTGEAPVRVGTAAALGLQNMKGKNLALFGSALFGIPSVFAALAFADARLELGIMHSTLYSGTALFGFVLAGLYLLWLVSFRVRWQRFAAAVAYAPAMFVFLSWVALVIQFTFDDRTAQQAVAADRPKTGTD